MNENRISQFPIFILVAAFVFSPLFFLPVIHSFIIPRLTLVEVVIIFIIALYLIEGKEKIKDVKLLIPWGLMNIAFFISIFSSPSLLTGWKTFIFFFLLTSFSLIVSKLTGIKRRFDILLLSVLAPGIINSAYMYAQYKGLDFGIMKSTKFIVLGTLGSPGMLGGYFSICCLISFHFFATSREKIKSIIYAVVTLFFIFVSTVTLSRTSLLSIASGLLAYFITSLLMKRTFPTRLSRCVMGVLLLSLTATVLLVPSTGIYNYAVKSDKNIQSYFFNRYKSNSVLQRRLIWKSAIEIIKENPLRGSGAGSFFYEYPKAQAKILNGRELTGSFPRIAADRIATYAHNDYLQFAAETGIPGIACFLLFPIFSLVVLYKRCRNKDPFSTNYAPVIISGITAIMVQSLFDFPMYMPATALIFWFLIGSSHIKSFSEFKKERKPSFSFRLLIYSTSGVLAFTVMMPLASAIHLSLANRYIVNGDIFKANQALENALAYDPSEPEVYVAMGRLERIKGNFSQSMMDYGMALQFSNHPSHFYGKGMAAFLSGNIEEAKKAFSSVLEIDPRSTDAMMAMALIYMETEDIQNAFAMLRRILIVDPSNKEALGYIRNMHIYNHN